MKSAFGIEHTISKSQISPGVFKPITAASKLERAKVGRRLAEGYKEGYGFAQRPGTSAGRKIWATQNTGMASKTKIVDSPEVHSKTLRDGKIVSLKGRSQFNGRGGGTITLYPGTHKFNRTQTLTHEMAHVAPRRNPWTAQQRMKDPYRLGREEGRADFTAHGVATPGGYGNRNPEFTRGYDEVQGRMGVARNRKSR